ncbi:hypothetical protein GALL_213770 [mine drainage metagenome]|uniref:Uncharacterized protein n=1 Tax=mine drainage metagenome TaxID=410659 RepID=A0A1J5RMB7_9ZZZZ
MAAVPAATVRLALPGETAKSRASCGSTGCVP